MGCAAAACFAMGGCFDLAKSDVTWSRTDESRVSTTQMVDVVRQACQAAGLAEHDRRYPSNSVSVSGSAPTGALVFVWRKGVWMVTGLPLTVVAAAALIPPSVLLVIPTKGWSLLLPLAVIGTDVYERLAANTLDVKFTAVDLGNGRSRGTCSIEETGMFWQARRIKSKVWHELDWRFKVLEKEDGAVGNEWRTHAPTVLD
jgi:hypothetical protein